MQRLTQHYANDGLAARDQADAMSHATRRQTVLALIVAIAVMSAAAAVLYAGVVPPIRRAVLVAQAIAGGRLDTRIDVRGRGETAALLGVFATMQRSIADAMGEIEAQHLAERDRGARSAQQARQLSDAARRFEDRIEATLVELVQRTGQMREMSATMSRSADDTSRQAEMVDTMRQSAAEAVGGIGVTIGRISGSISAAVEQQDAATDTVSTSIASVTAASGTIRAAADRVLEATEAVSGESGRMRAEVGSFLQQVRREAA